MKLFIVLSLLLFPSNVAFATHHPLTCSEYEFIIEGLNGVEDFDQEVIKDLREEIMNSTDPDCFS